MFRSIALGLIVTLLLSAAPPVRDWHDAKVVSVKSTTIFRAYEIIDSHDPGCRLRYRELRNPFKPLDMKEGATVQIAEGNRFSVYLVDGAGRVHKGTLIMQDLLPPPPPPPQDRNLK